MTAFSASSAGEPSLSERRESRRFFFQKFFFDRENPVTGEESLVPALGLPDLFVWLKSSAPLRSETEG